ncbi:hypothetical protein EDB86DRAFT_1794166 [Lactarius hatsudake]|nr:hypothetical protein EDB86DRAFT_1794166 [Lactarius hatsudake]
MFSVVSVSVWRRVAQLPFPSRVLTASHLAIDHHVSSPPSSLSLSLLLLVTSVVQIPSPVLALQEACKPFVDRLCVPAPHVAFVPQHPGPVALPISPFLSRCQD